MLADLVVVATDTLRRPTARVCELDGSSCSQWNVDSALGPESAAASGLFVGLYAIGTVSTFDATSRQLFIATNSLAQGESGLRLIQCGIDSRVCSERQVSASVGSVSFFVDAAAGRVLVFEAGIPILRRPDSARHRHRGSQASTIVRLQGHLARASSCHPRSLERRGYRTWHRRRSPAPSLASMRSPER